MSALLKEEVLSVHHWTDNLFSFTTSRASSLRFKNGHFIMIGLEVEGRPLMRAYSIASANYEDHLEFFSIKVPDGPLTSRLQNIQPGDEIMLSSKPTGTLVNDHLLPGKNLYLISTGTGLAPFLSIIRDPEIYEQYDKVILTHGCRYVSELAYQELIMDDLPKNEYFGDLIREKLIYYPTVTREAFKNTGRLTDLMRSGKLFGDLGMPAFDVENDRFMICGGPSMLKETCEILNEQGFSEGKNSGAGHYVIERAFVES
ncbi:ferredoxin--NADP reductase [Oceanospirillum beijerinckii]|uniref:ferredoxin--NADP reductase n=1 Tax=Oceanospirillum beijerinckii TaxID=64976 RepID=UPI0003F50096|nr:ferredoxin--NADP reductase [Oceanospirillum beijerinckii]MAC47545.1 ferredoxin--NADP reductase [Oceanospirillum sp.]